MSRWFDRVMSGTYPVGWIVNRRHAGPSAGSGASVRLSMVRDGYRCCVSDDRDDMSEQLDGDVLGERPGDPDRPGVGDYPPDRSLGVEDPSLFDEDDLATRAVLRRDVGTEPAGDVMLVDPAPIDGTDHDETLTGEGIDLAGDGTGPVPTDDLSAEEAAVHVIGDPDESDPDAG
jgi:hypothetical protein